MYAVVGCSDCTALWVIEGRPKTIECPRCGTTRGYEKRRKFLTTDDRAHAREVRASMLANRQGEGEAFADLDSFDRLEDRIEEAGVDDREYLDRLGVDADAVAAAGDRATQDPGGANNPSRPELVLAALRDGDRPDREAVLEYASRRGVPPEAAADVLDRLVRRGDVVETDDGYRLL